MFKVGDAVRFAYNKNHNLSGEDGVITSVAEAGIYGKQLTFTEPGEFVLGDGAWLSHSYRCLFQEDKIK